MLPPPSSPQGTQQCRSPQAILWSPRCQSHQRPSSQRANFFAAGNLGGQGETQTKEVCHHCHFTQHTWTISTCSPHSQLFTAAVAQQYVNTSMPFKTAIFFDSHTDAPIFHFLPRRCEPKQSAGVICCCSSLLPHRVPGAGPSSRGMDPGVPPPPRLPFRTMAAKLRASSSRMAVPTPERAAPGPRESRWAPTIR